MLWNAVSCLYVRKRNLKKNSRTLSRPLVLGDHYGICPEKNAADATRKDRWFWHVCRAYVIIIRISDKRGNILGTIEYRENKEDNNAIERNLPRDPSAGLVGRRYILPLQLNECTLASLGIH